MYVSGQGAGTLLKYPAGTTTPTTMTIASNTGGTAIDGAGNVYVTTASGLYEVPVGSTAGMLINSSLTTLDNNLSVDAAGDLFGSDTNTGSIYELPAGELNTNTTLVAGSGHRFIGMAIDASGDLFAADYNNSALYEVVAGSGALKLLYSGSPLANPDALALDAGGNVYVANIAGSTVYRFAAGNYGATPTSVNVAAQQGLAIGPDGSIYAVTGNSTLARYILNATSLAFPNTQSGTSSAAQSVLLESDGNVALGASVTAPAGYSIVAGSGTSASCGTSFSLAVGSTCNLGVEFSPTAINQTYSGNVTVQDNSSVGGTTQAIAVTGTGVGTSQTITFSPPSPVAVGSIVTLSATASSRLPVTISLVSGAATLSGDTLTVTGPGLIVLSATQAGNATYAPVTVTASILTTNAVGTTNTRTLTLTILQDGTVGSIILSNQDHDASDYSLGTTGTCKTGTPYIAGATCTIAYTWTPHAAGLRHGGVQLFDSNGDVLASAYLSDTAVAPEPIFAATSLYATGGDYAGVSRVVQGVALGTSLYYVDGNEGPVVAFISSLQDYNLENFGGGSGAPFYVLSQYPASVDGNGQGGSANFPDRFASEYAGLSANLAVDGNGYTWLDQGNTGVVVRLSAATPADVYVPGLVQVTETDFSNAGKGLVASAGNGSLYYVDSHIVWLLPMTNGYVDPALSPIQVGSVPYVGNGAESIAVDPSGNVYVVAGNGSLYEFLAVNGVVPAGAQQLNLGSPGFEFISFDPLGNLYGVTSDLSHIEKIFPVNGVIPANATPVAATPTATYSGNLADSNVSVGATGTIWYGSNANGNNVGTIDELHFDAPPSYSFPTTALGASSLAQSIPVTNFGNSALVISNIVASTNFAVSGGTCTAGISLAQNQSCTVLVTFSPTSGAGALTGKLTLTDNALNVAGSTQSFALSGTATLDAQTILFPQPTTPVNPGSQATMMANASSGLPVTYTITSGPATVSGAVVSYTAAGTVVITASQAGNADFSAATPVSVTVQVTTLTVPVVLWTPSSLTSYAGAPLGSGVLNATSTVLGTITYTATPSPSGSSTAVTAATALPPGHYTLTATLTPSSSTYAMATASISFMVVNQEVFVANGTGSVTSLYDNGAVETSATAGGGIGAAVDGSGYVWSINASGSSVSKFTDAGALAVSYSGAGIGGASALAIDGNGVVWIANSGSVSALTNAGAAVSTTPVAQAGNISAPSSITVDAAGSLWIANTGNNTVTEVIGVAAPVTAPVVTQVNSSTPGSKP